MLESSAYSQFHVSVPVTFLQVTGTGGAKEHVCSPSNRYSLSPRADGPPRALRSLHGQCLVCGRFEYDERYGHVGGNAYQLTGISVGK